MHIASLFNAKAKKWVTGRKGIFTRLEETIPQNEKIIWMHCASLGEFEQGRPVIEKLKYTYPRHKILITFFSPSGYEAQKNYQLADWVFYLPADGPRNAKKFLEIVNPSLVIFVKYEFWYYYLKKIKYRNIPLLLISAIFRKEMSFFKWHGMLQRKMLSRFDHLFVQTKQSKLLLDGIGLGSICTVSGDTRFDRVIEIAEEFTPLPLIENFIANVKVIVAGSTWPADEIVLKRMFTAPEGLPTKLIIAPHEISDKHIADIKNLFPDAVLYSSLVENEIESLSNCLIIDNIGMLSRLYYYATFTYIGGGLTPGGVHNVLEAAVYYKPVLFGPYFQKYSEAVGLLKAGGGWSFRDKQKNGIALTNQIKFLLENNAAYEKMSTAAGEFIHENIGASAKIISFIQEKRLLTN